MIIKCQGSLIAGLLLFILSGCMSGGGGNTPPATPAFPRILPGKAFALQESQTVNIINTPHTLKFERVVNDSRCPEGQHCIWQGVATIALQMNSNGVGRLLSLDTLSSGSFSSSKPYRDYKVALRKLEAINNAGSTSYVATLLVNRI